MSWRPLKDRRKSEEFKTLPDSKKKIDSELIWGGIFQRGNTQGYWFEKKRKTNRGEGRKEGL